MKTLVVYYSKTGTGKKVADKIIEQKQCAFDEIQYDDNAKTISYIHSPSDYDHIILIAPVWAFSLADPMKQYVAKHKSDIKRYDLIVTCSMGGLRGCVKNCLSSIGKSPENALKFKAKQVKSGEVDLSAVL